MSDLDLVPPGGSGGSDPAPGRPVVVLGLMGAGKTTLAVALATRWGRPLRDSDLDLQARFGRTAAQLAAERGADGLHDREAEQLLEALPAAPAPVIAAAASVVERQPCRDALRAAAVIWLDVPVEQLVARQAIGGHRPAYRADLLAMLQDMDAVRRPFFQTVATLVLHPASLAGTDPARVLPELVAEVETRLRSSSGSA